MGHVGRVVFHTRKLLHHLRMLVKFGLGAQHDLVQHLALVLGAQAHIELQEGDTVRLRAENKGKVLHEIVLGTKAELDQHAQMMQKFPGMEHDAPYMAHVRAGQRGDIVWHFNRPGTFDFACLIPGHYEAGMTGTITVRPRSR